VPKQLRVNLFEMNCVVRFSPDSYAFGSSEGQTPVRIRFWPKAVGVRLADDLAGTGSTPGDRGVSG
jgi:hypothetical protein